MAKRVYVVGVGPGDPQLLTLRAMDVIRRCRTVAGSRRALEVLRRLGLVDESKNVVVLGHSFRHEIEALLRENSDVVIVSTGDPMYAGLGRLVLEATRDGDIDIVPGISSLQLAAARIGIDWANTVLVDLHSYPDEKLLRYALSELVLGRAVAMTLHTRFTAYTIANRVVDCGYTDTILYVCENVGRENERILVLDLSRDSIDVLKTVSVNAVVFLVPKRRFLRSLAGDDLYAPPEVPGPSKEEIRSVVAVKTSASPGDRVLEIGCGCGAITIELARRVFPDGEVVAVDRSKEAIEATKINCSRYGVAHLVRLVHGEAPDVLRRTLDSNTRFRAVVIDAGKRLRENIEYGYGIVESRGRVIVVCVTVESFIESIRTFRDLGIEPEIVSLNVARSRRLGGYISMAFLNPINIVIGEIR